MIDMVKPMEKAAAGQKTAVESQTPMVLIIPSIGCASSSLVDIWSYCELLYFLVWWDVKGRYSQMDFSPLWIILQPFIQMGFLHHYLRPVGQSAFGWGALFGLFLCSLSAVAVFRR